MRAEKQLLLDEIKQYLTGASAFVVMSYAGLDPNMASELRHRIVKEGGTFSVVKKRLLVKAASELGMAIDKIELKGHIGVVYAGESPIATAKTIYEFKKDHQEQVEVLGGVFEGQFCSSEETKEIATLPTRDEMRAQLLAVFEAPMANTLGVCEALLGGVVSCIDQKVEKEAF